MPSNFTVIEPNYSLDIILWNATLLLHQLIQILSKFKQHLRLFTNRIWHTHSSRHKRKFCTETFRLTIRESRARDVYPTIDDVTAPYDPLYVIVSIIVGIWNLSIIAHPINFDIQRERSLKWHAKNSTYIYVYRYHALDNRYGFTISIGNTKNHVATSTCLEWHTENMLIFPL